MKKLITLLMFLCIETVSAQITITSSDMHVVNDTVRTSLAYNADVFDFLSTGSDFTWDFSALKPAAQTIDTFYAVNTLPILIYLSFVSSANLVKPFQIANLLPEIGMEEMPNVKIYQLFNNTTSSFKDVGYGVELDGLGIPLKYGQADEIYRFPMTYGQAFSANALLEANIPNVGTLMIDRERQNEVDGWGTIITPYGTFDALRYRSIVQEVDSVDFPSYEISQRVERRYTEYHWLTKEWGTPILKVHVEEGVEVPVVTYIDSVRVITVGMDKFEGQKNLVAYPNPTYGIINIQLDDLRDVQGELAVFDVNGCIVYREQVLNPGLSTIRIDLRLLGVNSGIFFVSFVSDNKIFRTKVVVQ